MNSERLNLIGTEHKPRCIYEFDSDFRISYVNYTAANTHADSQLLLTLEKGDERKTFAFFEPEFADVDKNLVSARGLFISHVPGSSLNSSRVEMGDRDGCIFFSAKRCKNITPMA